MKKSICTGMSLMLMLPQFVGAQEKRNPSNTNNRGEAVSSGDKIDFATARPEDITDENFPDIIDSFDYPNADLMDVVKAISKLTKKNFIIDKEIGGQKISIIAPTPITKAEAYRAFLAALAVNNITVVPSGKFLKLRTSQNAIMDNLETYSGEYFPNTEQMITKIMHLKHISAEEVKRRLDRLRSKVGTIEEYGPTNTLIISDYGTKVEQIVGILKQLDVPNLEDQLEVIPVRHAKAKDLATLIDTIVNKGQGTQATAGRPTFRSNIPQFQRNAGNAKSESFFVTPDDRTNSLIIVGNTFGIERIKKLVRRLDFKMSAEEAGGVFVYYVQHGDAEKLAATLGGIAKESGASTGTPGTPQGRAEFSPTREAVFGGDVKITADKATNSLVITANRQDYEVVKDILSKIDRARDQVFVEAIILEMVAQDTFNYNPNLVRSDPGSNGLGRVGFRSSSIAEILNPAGDSGTILGFATGEDVKVDLGKGTPQTVKSLMSFIQLLQSVTKVDILSNPTIMAMDNETAEIEVGDDVPIGSSTTATAAGTQTSTTRDKASIKLEIEPNISPNSDIVRLKIVQMIKSLSDKQINAKNIADSAIAMSERSVKTNISLASGNTAVLGGLINDRTSETVKKVPLLGDIPILGWLFKSRGKTTEKVNLLVFITPKIIRNNEDHHRLVSRKLDQRVDFLKKNAKGVDPFGATVDGIMQNYSGSASPGLPGASEEESNIQDTLTQ